MEIESIQCEVREPAAATREGIVDQQASSIHVDPISTSCNDNSTNQSIPSVLGFHNVGYLEFNPATNLAVVSQQLRSEMIVLGLEKFQNKDSQHSVPGM